MVEVPRDLLEALGLLGPEARRALLRYLTLDRAARAGVIGRLYQHPETCPAANLLIDLEADEMARALLIEALRALSP